jgi:hypothetical protein
MQKKNMRGSIHYKIVLGTLLFVVLGCKTKQQATTYPDQYFTISLYSIGTGIDREADALILNRSRVTILGIHLLPGVEKEKKTIAFKPPGLIHRSINNSLRS